MNEQRYFYTDPLAAAWLSKYFGMTFFGWEQIGIISTAYRAEVIDLSPKGCAEKPELFLFTDRIFISPDSLHLLKPQMNDHGFYEDGGQFTFNGKAWEDCNLSVATEDVKIDRRDGRAFFWPESVAA